MEQLSCQFPGQWFDVDHVRTCPPCRVQVVRNWRDGSDQAGGALAAILMPWIARQVSRRWTPTRDMESFSQDVLLDVLDHVATGPDFESEQLAGRLGQFLGAAVRFAVQRVARELSRAEQGAGMDAPRLSEHIEAPQVVENDAITVRPAELADAFRLVQSMVDGLPSSEADEFEAWMAEVRTGRARGAIANAARSVHGVDDNATRQAVGRRIARRQGQLRQIFEIDLRGDASAAGHLLALWGIALDQDLDCEPGWGETAPPEDVDNGEGGTA